MHDVWAIASKGGNNFFAGFGVDTNFAWQTQKFERVFIIDLGDLFILGQTRALWFLVIFHLADLQVGSEATGTQRDVETGFGILAEHLGFAKRIFAFLDGELACEFAVRIIRATNKGAEAAHLEAELTGFTVWTFARIDAFFLDRKHMRREDFIQTVENLCNAHISDILDLDGKVLPEIPKECLPSKFPL